MPKPSLSSVSQSHHFRCEVSRWFLGKSSSMMLHGIPQGPCHHAQVWWCRCSHPWWLVSWFELRISSFIKRRHKTHCHMAGICHNLSCFLRKRSESLRPEHEVFCEATGKSGKCIISSAFALSLAGSERPWHRKTWHCGKTRIRALGCCAAAVRGNARQLSNWIWKRWFTKDIKTDVTVLPRLFLNMDQNWISLKTDQCCHLTVVKLQFIATSCHIQKHKEHLNFVNLGWINCVTCAGHHS